MHLLDTNILLELLLDQNRADEVELFLRVTPPDSLHLSDFSLFSLGIILSRRRMYDVFIRAITDLLLAGGIGLLRLGAINMEAVVQTAQRFNLDFDDAYQYVVAENHDLTIVSFDHDFDRTQRGRKTPGQLMQP
ncbi:MAG: PIN domain-containing protein [Chloroflexota bacterium]